MDIASALLVTGASIVAGGMNSIAIRRMNAHKSAVAGAACSAGRRIPASFEASSPRSA
jgi:hypothetical protein